MSQKLTEETERRVEVAWANNPKMVPASVAVAALMAAMLGMLALAVFHGCLQAVQCVGARRREALDAEGRRASVPTRARRRSPWSSALRGRDMKLSAWLVVFGVRVGVATTLIWPPVFEYLAGH